MELDYVTRKHDFRSISCKIIKKHDDFRPRSTVS
jgi:hypothetical protein